jgi:outer membrane protein assembly factor BamD
MTVSSWKARKALGLPSAPEPQAAAGRVRPVAHAAVVRGVLLACTLCLVTSLGALLGGCAADKAAEPLNVTIDRLYREARADMEAGAYERAINGFQRVEGLAAGTVLAQQALLDTAYLRWRSDERALALSAIERFIKQHPSSPGLDYALYLRGLINFNDNVGLLAKLVDQSPSERDQRASRDALQAFGQLVDQFPESAYAADARLRMAYILNSLAEHELHVARYYLRRGAYLAAANRAQQVVANYPTAPANEEALAVMVQAYEKLNLPTLRDSSARVLRQSFPDSRFLGELPAAALQARAPEPVAAAPVPAPPADLSTR